MAELAIYGKGGIGKSTIAANISAALAKQGKRVLQIGCDPKHDSTRLLLGGRRITTVLDYLRETGPGQGRRTPSLPEEIVHAGAFGVHCIEAGGPEPGVGCAGRGILTTFELIRRLGIRDYPYDAVIYDVLGDVVCGGFAVPLRREYAEKVYIVSSGEFMALYAANNILRGLKNYDQSRGRAGGIILNSRGLPEEDGLIRRFCDAVELPLLESFPRSEVFSGCEREGMSLVERDGGSELAAKFEALAALMYRQEELYPPRPLSDEELEDRIFGERKRPAGRRALGEQVFGEVPKRKEAASAFVSGVFSKSLIAREPLQGCAFSGAMGVCTQVGDCVCIAHGPVSCAHITYQSITSASRRFLLERGIVLPYQASPPVLSSQMNETVMIFGGVEALRKKLAEARAAGSAGIFVLTTCPSGIIGDDLGFLRDMEAGESRIIPLLTDGNLQGDFLQGILMAYTEIARALIDRTVAARENTVNIVAEKPETTGRGESLRYMKDILDRLGIEINCHFICETSLEEIRCFMRGKLSILAFDDYMGRTIRDFLRGEFGAEFLDRPFPVGFRESAEWVRLLASSFGRPPETAGAIIADYRDRYEGEILRIKPYLAGKRLMVITFNHDIDWILQTALDLEMEVAFLAVMDFSQENLFRTIFRERIGEFRVSYDRSRRRSDIERVKPDLFLANYPSPEEDGRVLTDVIPFCPVAGFLSGLLLARRWSEIFRMNLYEGWKQDEVLFRKYQS
ncbi:MAG: AAA family ATPase [Spirochaetaceae bacterium]|jgi:nitrogenase iron protein|nr:AAA family ATPase [Spirochaetaceae bacterium]